MYQEYSERKFANTIHEYNVYSYTVQKYSGCGALAQDQKIAAISAVLATQESSPLSQC